MIQTQEEMGRSRIKARPLVSTTQYLVISPRTPLSSPYGKGCICVINATYIPTESKPIFEQSGLLSSVSLNSKVLSDRITFRNCRNS